MRLTGPPPQPAIKAGHRDGGDEMTQRHDNLTEGARSA